MGTLNRDLLRRLDPSGVGVTAQVQPDGALLPVEDLFEKLAALRDRSLPHTHTVVVAAGQAMEGLGLERDPHSQNLFLDPRGEFHVIACRTLAQAVELLALDAQTRWGAIPDFAVELGRHRDFVGRGWLKEMVGAFVEGQAGGYLVLVAGPGVGKSAFVAEEVRAARQPVYHFIKRDMGDWDQPEAMLASLTAQLRRKHALPQTQTEGRMTPAAAFLSTLGRVSRGLGPGEKEVIYLDGLDEAFGPTGRHARVALPGVLPGMLPQGILMVLTSRPGEHLHWLADPKICQPQEIDPAAAHNLDDIRSYLSQRSEALGLGLDGAFVERLVEASEGVFAVAVLYLEQRPRLRQELEAWRKDPGPIPRGLAGWLTQQWQWVVTMAGEKGIGQETVKLVLGLLALAREPLSWDHLTAFLSPASRGKRHRGPAAGIGLVPLGHLARRLHEVLELCQEFFDPLDPAQGAASPYRFFHTRFAEFIAGKLSEVEREDCHRLLAQGCGSVARSGARPGPVRDYALRHRLAHLIAAREWEQVARAFGEASFIVERGERFGFGEVHADALAAAEHPDLPAEWRNGFAELERFLRWRIERLRPYPAAYPQEVSNEFLPVALGQMRHALATVKDGGALVAPVYLRKTFGPPTLGGFGHTLPVASVAFSPDGQLLASASHDGTVKVWDASTRRLVADCLGNTLQAESAAFSPDGLLLALGTWEGTVKIWEARTGRLVADCAGYGYVDTVAFSPDGGLVASGTREGSVKVWEARTGRLVADCVGHKHVVSIVAFSPDGRLLASASWDHTVKVWKPTTGHLVADCLGHSDWVHAVAFSPDGRLVGSGSRDHTVKVWKAKTGDLVADCLGHEGSVNALAFSSAGRFLATGSSDQTVKLWEARTGCLVADWVGHRAGVHTVAFSSKGLVASGCSEETIMRGRSDHTVKVWGVRTGRLVADCAGHRGGVLSLAFSPDGRLLASGSNDATVKVWEPRTGRLVAECAGQNLQQRARLGPVDNLAFSPDGQLVAWGSDDRTVKVRQAQTGRLVAYCLGHAHEVNSVAFSPDGHLLASGSDDGTVKVWEPTMGRLVADCRGHQGPVLSMVFSPDSQLLASGGLGTLWLWDARTGRRVARRLAHFNWVTSLAFSRDGQYLASGGWDGVVKVWMAKTGRLVAKLGPLVNREGRSDWVFALAFSPDGPLVASGTWKGTVKVWEARTGRLLADCSGHIGNVNSMAFSCDGQLLASGGSDRTVKVWEALTSTCVNTLFFDREVIEVAFIAGDPVRLMVADGGARVFHYQVVRGFPSGA